VTLSLTPREIQQRAKELRILILDVDGVMTDGGIILVGKEEEAKRFDVQDGMGVTLARAAGLKVGIITGRKSAVVRRRAQELNIDEVCAGHFGKAEALDFILDKYNLDPAQVAYIGDDILDLPVMRVVGLPIAVANARPEVKAASLYVTNSAGGHGAIREAVDWLLELRGERNGIYELYASGGAIKA